MKSTKIPCLSRKQRKLEIKYLSGAEKLFRDAQGNESLSSDQVDTVRHHLLGLREFLRRYHEVL